MRRFLALLIALCMLLPCAAGFTPAAAEGGTDSSQPRSGTSEDRNDDDADDDDDDDDDDDKGGSFVNPNDLSFKGPLSDYQPKRENYSGLYSKAGTMMTAMTARRNTRQHFHGAS